MDFDREIGFSFFLINHIVPQLKAEKRNLENTCVVVDIVYYTWNLLSQQVLHIRAINLKNILKMIAILWNNSITWSHIHHSFFSHLGSLLPILLNLLNYTQRLTSKRRELFNGCNGPSYSASSTSDKSTPTYIGFSVSSYCEQQRTSIS